MPFSLKAFFVLILFSFSSSHCQTHLIEIQGHRGSRGTLPENTLPGFEAAIAAGVNRLELDLHISADGEVIIHHNFFTRSDLSTYKDGTALNGDSLISNWTLEELKKLDCGAKINPEFPLQKAIPGTEIPTLQELFDGIQSSPHPNAKHVCLNLELKRDPRSPHYSAPPDEFASKVLNLVKENGFSKRVCYSSFDPEILSHLRKQDPEATIGFIYGAKTIQILSLEQLLKRISSISVQILSPDHDLLKNRDDVQSLKQMGFRIIPWTVNDPERWEELIQMGVDGLITDYPQQLIDFLSERKFK